MTLMTMVQSTWPGSSATASTRLCVVWKQGKFLVLKGMRPSGRSASNISGLSDDEDAVQSGSATGFSDGDPDETPSPVRPAAAYNKAFDPVNTILDKIDAELVSLTRSQASSTATESTVIHRPGSQMSQDPDVVDSDDRLSLSQLRDCSSPRNGFTPRSSSSHKTRGSDRDTGFGTGNSSFHDDSMRSREDSHKRSRSHDPRLQNGLVHHVAQSDDDKTKTLSAGGGETMEAKQVDDKFRELMQKRRGAGYLEAGKSRGGHTSNDDAETIRTEDFADRFHDTLVYSSDEAERLKNIEDDLSDGGFDTDTLQQKLFDITNPTTQPDARSSKRQSRAPERPRRKLLPSSERWLKKGPPGVPPAYPKPPSDAGGLPRPTSIVRPSSSGRGGIKLTGHTSDADSVRTEDFESRFQDTMIQAPESDLDLDGTASKDPIHTRVKELLKATAKYKPKTEPFKPKQHVRISSPPQYQTPDKGDDSDETLCSDKEDTSRKWSSGRYDYSRTSPHLLFSNESWAPAVRRPSAVHSRSSSLDDSLSRSSQSSLSLSSSDRDVSKQGDNSSRRADDIAMFQRKFSRQFSVGSSLASTSYSDYPVETSSATSASVSTNNSRSTSTSDSMFEELEAARNALPSHYSSQYDFSYDRGPQPPQDHQYILQRAQQDAGEKDYSSKQNLRKRDLIVPDEDEEFPFSKHTFNRKVADKDSMSSVSRSSLDTIDSRGLMEQYMQLKGTSGNKGIQNRSSSSSLYSSLNSLNSTWSEPNTSIDDMSASTDLPPGPDLDWYGRTPAYSHMSNAAPVMQDPRGMVQQPFPTYPARVPVDPVAPSSSMRFTAPNAEEVLSNLGFVEPESFLPKRFLRSWYDKVVQNQRLEFYRQQRVAQQSVYYPDFYEDHDLPPSVSAQQSCQTSPNRRQSSDSNVNQAPFSKPNTEQHKRFKRAHSLNHIPYPHRAKQSVEEDQSQLVYPHSKETSFDKLKRILEQSSNYKSTNMAREERRNQFAHSRQKSLPLFLETLSEEEEVRSRSPSIEFPELLEAEKAHLKSKSKQFLCLHESSSEMSEDSSAKSSLPDTVLPDIYDVSGNHNRSKSDQWGETPGPYQPTESNTGPAENNGENNASPKHSYHRNLSYVQVPSIVVSEKVDAEAGNPCVVQTQSSHHRSGSPTGASSTQQDDRDMLHSKDSLEVAEIMSGRQEKLGLKLPRLSAIESVSRSPTPEQSRQGTREDQLVSSTRLLSVNTDTVSPAPSTVSSIQFSPVTVIEVSRLDNHNDSLDTEEQNMKCQEFEEVSDKQNSKSSQQCSSKDAGEKNSQLALQRRIYPVGPCDSEMFSTESVETETQASDGSLVPLIKESDIAKLLVLFLRGVPGEVDRMFHLVQDKGTQVGDSAGHRSRSEVKMTMEDYSSAAASSHCSSTDQPADTGMVAGSDTGIVAGSDTGMVAGSDNGVLVNVEEAGKTASNSCDILSDYPSCTVPTNSSNVNLYCGDRHSAHQALYTQPGKSASAAQQAGYHSNRLTRTSRTSLSGRHFDCGRDSKRFVSSKYFQFHSKLKQTEKSSTPIQHPKTWYSFGHDNQFNAKNQTCSEHSNRLSPLSPKRQMFSDHSHQLSPVSPESEHSNQWSPLSPERPTFSDYSHQLSPVSPESENSNQCSPPSVERPGNKTAGPHSSESGHAQTELSLSPDREHRVLSEAHIMLNYQGKGGANACNCESAFHRCVVSGRSSVGGMKQGHSDYRSSAGSKPGYSDGAGCSGSGRDVAWGSAPGLLASGRLGAPGGEDGVWVSGFNRDDRFEFHDTGDDTVTGCGGYDFGDDVPCFSSDKGLSGYQVGESGAGGCSSSPRPVREVDRTWQSSPVGRSTTGTSPQQHTELQGPPEKSNQYKDEQTDRWPVEGSHSVSPKEWTNLVLTSTDLASSVGSNTGASAANLDKTKDNSCSDCEVNKNSILTNAKKFHSEVVFEIANSVRNPVLSSSSSKLVIGQIKASQQGSGSQPNSERGREQTEDTDSCLSNEENTEGLSNSVASTKFSANSRQNVTTVTKTAGEQGDVVGTCSVYLPRLGGTTWKHQRSDLPPDTVASCTGGTDSHTASRTLNQAGRLSSSALDPLAELSSFQAQSLNKDLGNCSRQSTSLTVDKSLDLPVPQTYRPVNTQFHSVSRADNTQHQAGTLSSSGSHGNSSRSLDFSSNYGRHRGLLRRWKKEVAQSFDIRTDWSFTPPRVNSEEQEDSVNDLERVDKHPDDTDSLAETRREIARESARIRKEMERERRSQSSSPVRPREDRSPTRTYLTLTTSPRTSGEPEKSPRKSLSDEEKEKTAELRITQDALQITQKALLESQKQLKETQAQMEDIRNQLMVLEYKKENTDKELSRVTENLSLKKKQVKCYENQVRSRLDEIKQFDSIGFTKEEAVQIIEANEKMKNRLRNLDAVHLERDELIHQLETTKQELFHEQKQARNKQEELKEELETVTSQLEQTQAEKEDITKKVNKLEARYRGMEKEKNELIQEKSKLYEEEREKSKLNRQELRKQQDVEVDELRQDLAEMSHQLSTLQDTLHNREQQNSQLRDKVAELQQDLDREKSNKGIVFEEHKKTLQNLRRETDAAMVQLRESLFLEKQKTVDALRHELDQERREVTSRTEERLNQQLADHLAVIKAKEEEVRHLERLVGKLEKEQTANQSRIQDEIKLQVHEAVNHEREELEKERKWIVQQERENLQIEHRHQMKLVQDEAIKERQKKESLERKLKEIKDELEDVRAANKQGVHEKLIAVARAKELMRQEHLTDLDRIRDQLKNDHQKELDKLRETIRIQEEELRQLRAERHKWQRQEREVGTVLDKTERTLVNEINEECRRTSEVLGLSPRKVNVQNYRGDNGYVVPPVNGSLTKTPTTSALGMPSEPLFSYSHAQQIAAYLDGAGDLARNSYVYDMPPQANLRACNEELRNQVQELKQEVEVHRSTAYQADLHKDEALNKLKRQLEREKEQEMEKLKERLVKGLSTNEYRSLLYSPNNDLAKLRQLQQLKQEPGHSRHLSDTQQYEIDRLEREIKKLAVNQREMIGKQAPTLEDLNYSKALQQLQSKVKQLQEENNSLRRAKMTSASSSTPDLSNPALYNTPSHKRLTARTPTPTRDQERLASSLELRVKEAELETDTLSDQQRHSRGVMSQKMSEMSKLQNTLTNQAKELIQLEKAYTQLNHYAKSPRAAVR